LDGQPENADDCRLIGLQGTSSRIIKIPKDNSQSLEHPISSKRVALYAMSIVANYPPEVVILPVLTGKHVTKLCPALNAGYKARGQNETNSKS
jgi:hypothetical protein